MEVQKMKLFKKRVTLTSIMRFKTKGTTFDLFCFPYMQLMATNIAFSRGNLSF